MKKVYLLSLLSLLQFVAFGQATVYVDYANAATGSFVTANTTATVRTDNPIVTTGTTQRGYAIFDLSFMPPGTVLGSATLGYYITAYSGSAPSGWAIYGIDTMLAAYTTAADLFPVCTTGTLISTATFGTSTGFRTVTSAAAPPLLSFVQSRIGRAASITWTGGGTATYTIRGEDGVLSTSTANHAPFLNLSYCEPPTGLTATATPNPVCPGRTLTLSGSATGASGGYMWRGPDGNTWLGASPAFTASVTSAGVYTLTAVKSCGTYSASATTTTTVVGLLPLPAPITGPTAVCTGNTISLTSATGGGTWASSTSAVSIVSDGGATGAIPGTSVISYTLGTGCFVTTTVTASNAPSIIGGPTEVCVAGTVALTNAVAGGTWTTSDATVASVAATTGVVSGVASGVATITYTTGGCTPVVHSMTINPIPATITGPPTVCEGATVSLTTTSTGGSWVSSDITLALVGTSGAVYGNAFGPVNISYQYPSGCFVSRPITVNPTPPASTGVSDICIGSMSTFTNTFASGTWSSSNPAIATANAATGDIYGVSSGTVRISYIMPTGCFDTATVRINSLPGTISGVVTVCENSTITLSNATAGGTWSSATGTVAAIGTGSGIVTGLLAGTEIISYSLGTLCSRTVTVTVRPQPLAIITPSGPTTFCAGGSVTLNANAGAGYTYQWLTTGGTPIPGATNRPYTAFSTDSFQVVVTNPASCTNTSSIQFVSSAVSPAITLSRSSTSFCAGENIIMTVNTGSAVGSISYQWQRNSTNITAATAVSYMATITGLYTCEVTIAGGSGSCVATSDAQNIVVHPLPTPPIARPAAALITNTTYAGYQWYLNTVGIPGANSSSYVPTLNGNYRVQVTDGNGCKGYSPSFSITSVGLQGVVDRSAVRVYPNPVTDMVHFESPVSVKSVITSMDGRVLITAEAATSISVSILPKGIYLLHLYTEDGQNIAVEKLVKE